MALVLFSRIASACVILSLLILSFYLICNNYIDAVFSNFSVSSGFRFYPFDVAKLRRFYNLAILFDILFALTVDILI